MSSGAEVSTGKMPVGRIGNMPVFHPDVAPDVAVGDTFLRVRARRSVFHALDPGMLRPKFAQ